MKCTNSIFIFSSLITTFHSLIDTIEIHTSFLMEIDRDYFTIKDNIDKHLQ
jgi:hypothetical protein